MKTATTEISQINLHTASKKTQAGHHQPGEEFARLLVAVNAVAVALHLQLSLAQKLSVFWQL